MSRMIFMTMKMTKMMMTTTSRSEWKADPRSPKERPVPAILAGVLPAEALLAEAKGAVVKAAAQAQVHPAAQVRLAAEDLTAAIVDRAGAIGADVAEDAIVAIAKISHPVRFVPIRKARPILLVAA